MLYSLSREQAITLYITSKAHMYLVKDLARLSGLSTHTVKYYLTVGLIKEIGRSPETNFRYFDDSTLLLLKKVKDYRARGISIAKIKELSRLN